MKLSRARKIALLTLSILALLATSSPVQATAGHQHVNVLVAYDEEWKSIANNVYGYSPETLAKALLCVVSNRFECRFDIIFYIAGYKTWYSTNAGPFTMLDEAIAETGFHSGMMFSGNVVHILVAFTGEDIPQGAWGVSCKYRGAVLVEHAYPCGVGQATDNILQHELSNVFGALDHYEEDLNCVLNEWPHYIGFPCYYEVPKALVTTNWCSSCYNRIMNHRDDWGFWDTGGGGGDGLIKMCMW